jgi:hypothetical protein
MQRFALQCQLTTEPGRNIHASIDVAEVAWHAVFPEYGVLGAIRSNRLIANARDTDDPGPDVGAD